MRIKGNLSYVYVITDKNANIVEVWGSRIKVWKRCIELLGAPEINRKWVLSDINKATIIDTRDPYNLFTWERMELLR